MKELEIRHIRYFMAVAKELHFGRAAIAVHISQPALSVQIARLEEGLGVDLFIRDRRSVKLTAAGEVFYARSLELLNQVESTIKTMKDLVVSDRQQITVGLVEYTNLPFLVPSMREMQKLYPKIKFERRELTSDLQIRALMTNDIDVGFGILPAKTSALKPISHRPLIDGSWVALVPKSHRLAGKKEIRLNDLALESLIIFSRVVNPLLYDDVIARFKAVGITPTFVYETTQSALGIGMVDDGAGIMLAANYVVRRPTKKSVVVPILGLPPLVVSLFVRGNESSGLIHDFAEIVEEIAKKT